MRKTRIVFTNILHSLINWRNRIKLTNKTPTIIASNCTGGFLYHWLHLKFNSPFINLWMSNDDFITAMENFDNFINIPLEECHDSGMSYPVGIGYKGTKIYFQHYKTWEEATAKWEERKKRINPDNMVVMLSNFKGILANSDYDDETLIRRFNRLNFKNKIIFVDRPFPQYSNCVYIKDWHPENGVNVFDWNKNDFYKRYIDQFDYVKFLNNL